MSEKMTNKRETLQKLIDAWPGGISRQDFPRGFALAQRIADLVHKDGYEIESTQVAHQNRHGNKGHHAMYTILII